jgi:hypothetical protein
MATVIEIEASEFKPLARRLEALMKRAKVDDERDPLDYLLGALHGLIHAKRLGFKDRDHPLDDVRGHSAEGIDYWQHAPMKRVRLMAEGKLRIDGAWAAGFYFNSALARIAAVFDRAVRRRAIQKGLDRPWVPGSPPGPSVRKLLRDLGLGRFTRGKLADVYDEANPLKHAPAGLAKGRKITMAHATAAFGQMLDLLAQLR